MMLQSPLTQHHLPFVSQPSHTLHPSQQLKQEEVGAWDDGVASFIKSLLHMLQDPENVEVIYWTKRGSFVVRDCSEFETRILPKYFKTTKFCSFVRQLNTYGFRKVDSPPDPLQKRYEFHNRYFRAEHPELLKYIQRRKNSSKRDSAEIDLVDDLQRSPITELGGDGGAANALLLAELSRLQKQNDDTQLVLKKLVDEVTVWKKAHSELLGRVNRMEQREYERDPKRQKSNFMAQELRVTQPTMVLPHNMGHPLQGVMQLTTQHTQVMLQPHALPVKVERMEEWVPGIVPITEGGIPFDLLSSSLPQLEYTEMEDIQRLSALQHRRINSGGLHTI